MRVCGVQNENFDWRKLAKQFSIYPKSPKIIYENAAKRFGLA